MSQKIQKNPGGNTKTPGVIKKNISTNQLYCWFFTLKMEVIQMSQLFETLKLYCKKFSFQGEEGKSGYKHWQGVFSLKHKERMATVKNLFPNSIHLEPVQDWFASVSYCTKDMTRICGPYNQESVILNVLRHDQLYAWQLEALQAIKLPPNDRTINWFWEPNGNMGKTQFCKYLHVYHGATLIGNGAFRDIAQALPPNPTLVVLNLTREIEERLNYSALEAIKDGLVFSGKYESNTKVFNSPHLLIFANFEPRVNAMSADRWKIVRINNID